MARHDACRVLSFFSRRVHSERLTVVHRVARAVSGIALALLLASCSTETAYNMGQGWQRNQCEKIPDQGQRQQCLDKLKVGYEEYRKQTSDPDPNAK